MGARKTRLLWAAGVAAVVVAAVVGTAIATGTNKNVRGALEGYQEVPSVSTSASGSFTAQLANGGESIEYTLKYSALEGSVTQAHIHFGQKSVNGGISAFLCSNLPNPPAATQACPPGPATISGTITATEVVGPTGQGIAPGELPELVEAIRRGAAYANVHSSKFPGGEIRAQLRRGKSSR
jgi:hypothetical protein